VSAGARPVAVRPQGADRPFSRPFLAWVGALLAVMAVGGAAWIYQYSQGLAVTGLTNVVMWGQYILFFMFFVGLSAGGLIVASAGRLFGVTVFKPIVRLAVLEATVAIILAATFILPDLGRPERVLNILLYANPTSPMIWDIAIVFVYMGLSATYVWLYARADLARAGSPLAFGTSASDAAAARDQRLLGALAWVALPAAILLHSITAWIFGLQISRGFWYSAIMAPMFISSALVSGLGLVILLALAFRRFGRIRFANDLVAFLGGLLAVFIVVEAFFVFAEMLTAAYPGAPEEADAIHRLLTGTYAPIFWAEALVGLAVPFGILAVRRRRADPRWVAGAAGLAILGIWIHRLNLLLNGLSYLPVGSPPGVSIGDPVPGAGSFAVSYWYVPTLVEWLIVAGILAFGGLLLTIAARVLPLEEPAAH
jgi:molybdopterin-containing oxidoreductase family membrane subunit